ncbi:hypothetical protein QBC39DRAFT_50161 [Podospora conica]|nr:hypothetical protein QBC39DRAFT_50161 [Schizothecium conicum]
MRSSTLLLSVLGATVLAAPTFPDVNMEAVNPEGVDTISEYFTLLAAKVHENRVKPSGYTCDLTKAVLPQISPPLPPPGEGLYLKHIAIGRGTQNYTCANETTAPSAAGAVAVLYNASCLVATYPDLGHSLGKAALAFNLTNSDIHQAQLSQKLAPSNLIISGIHFFPKGDTPYFNMNLEPLAHVGEIPAAKDAALPAPPDAPTGQHGEAAVAWLKLKARAGATEGLREVFRVETVGGSAPASCKGMPPKFAVQYSTQ